MSSKQLIFFSFLFLMLLINLNSSHVIKNNSNGAADLDSIKSTVEMYLECLKILKMQNHPKRKAAWLNLQALSNKLHAFVMSDPQHKEELLHVINQVLHKKKMRIVKNDKIRGSFQAKHKSPSDYFNSVTGFWGK